MKKEILNDLKKSKTIIIIGLSVLGDSELKADLRKYFFKNIKNKKKCVVIGESDSQLFQYSLLTDKAQKKRISFEELKIRRDYFFKEISNNDRNKNHSNIKISSLQIPFLIIAVDESIWFLPAVHFEIDDYQKISKEDKLYSLIKSHIDYILDDSHGGKYVSEPDVELLELFDQNKVPRGIIPRNSFYNTDHYQYVIWGLVFNREGKLLIHKRSANAKDNQDMWDKSIGGHIDFNKERSTHEAAVRELIEELYTKEKKEQTGHSFIMLSEDIKKVYFLGDWRIENCGPEYLNHIKLIEQDKEQGEENWVFYKNPKTITQIGRASCRERV